MTPKHYVI